MNLGTATTLVDGKLTYHKTVVCELLPGGKTRLNSGGWRTATTKKRMNQFAEAMALRWRVYQHRGEWYVQHFNVFSGDDTITEYEDWMEV